LFAMEDWSEPETYLILPAVDFGSSIYNAKLSFWHVQRDWDGDQDKLYVYYRIPVWHVMYGYEGAWILLASFTDPILDWTHTTIDLPSVGPRYQIAFKGYSFYGYGVGLDKVEISASETPLPIELTSFTARSEERTVVLEWKTESETENVGYILEKQTSNSSTWLKLADYQSHEVLRGQGTTTCPSEYVFIDVDVVAGESYSYRLSDVSENGDIIAHPSIDISMNDISKTQIEKIYPNPFNPQTDISYSLHEDSDVKIRVVDIFGRIVKTLQNGDQTSGSYHVYWNGCNDSNTQAPSGMYFIQMQTDNSNEIQKVVLMK
jgi:FlgD Ig-like domain